MYSFPKCDVPKDEGMTTKEPILAFVIDEPDDYNVIGPKSMELMRLYPYEEKNEKTGGVYRSWYDEGNNTYGDPSEPLFQGYSVIWHQDPLAPMQPSITALASYAVKVFSNMGKKMRIDNEFTDQYTTTVEYIEFPIADLGDFNASEYERVLYSRADDGKKRYEDYMIKQEKEMVYYKTEWRPLKHHPIKDGDRSFVEFKQGDEKAGHCWVGNYEAYENIKESLDNDKIEWRYI